MSASAHKQAACARCGFTQHRRHSRRTDRPSPYFEYYGKPLSLQESIPPNLTKEVRAFTRGIAAEIREYNSELLHLKTYIAKVRKKRDEAVRFLEGHLALFSRIHDLPNELLLLIFGHYLSGFTHVSRQTISRQGPWALRRVCQRWNMLVNTTPSLWTCLSFEPYAMPVEETWLLEEALIRAAHLPLQMRVDMTRKTVDSYPSLSVAKGTASRLEALTLIGSPPRLSQCPTFAYVPVLRVLELQIIPEIGFFDVYLNRLLGGFVRCPSLRHLSIRGLEQMEDIDRSGGGCIYHTFPDELYAIPWTQLTTLEVHVGGDTGLIEALLEACPNLQVINLSTMLIAEEWALEQPPRAVQELPHLERASLNMCLDLPAILNCPALRYLQIIDADKSSLQAFFSRARPLLEEVQIHAKALLSVGTIFKTLPIVYLVVTGLKGRLSKGLIKWLDMALAGREGLVSRRPDSFPALEQVTLDFDEPVELSGNALPDLFSRAQKGGVAICSRRAGANSIIGSVGTERV